jgi:hypothetical protein
MKNETDMVCTVHERQLKRTQFLPEHLMGRDDLEDYLRIQSVPQREHSHHYKNQVVNDVKDVIAIYAENHTRPINTK